jgi:multiple sugar transport system permease protein
MNLRQASALPPSATNWQSGALFAPFALLVTFAFLFPVAAAVRTSLGTDPASGEGGFAVLVRDPLFRSAVYRTIRFSLIVVPVQLCLACLAAGFLVKHLPLSVFVGALSIPASVAPPAAALLWRLLLDPSNGLASNWVLDHPSLDWTRSPFAAQLVVATVDTWQWLPMLALVIGLWLSRVDARLIAMASLDGAAWWRRAWRVSLRPMLPFIGLLAAFRFADMIRIFDIPFVLTAGGPGSATEFISIYSYRYSLEFFRPIVGTAAGLVAFLLALAPSIVVLFASREDELI